MLMYDALFEMIKKRYSPDHVEIRQEHYKNPLAYDDDNMPDIALLEVPKGLIRMRYKGLEKYLGKGLVCGSMCFCLGNKSSEYNPLDSLSIDRLLVMTLQALEIPEEAEDTNSRTYPLAARVRFRNGTVLVEHCEGGRKYW